MRWVDSLGDSEVWLDGVAESKGPADLGTHSTRASPTSASGRFWAQLAGEPD